MITTIISDSLVVSETQRTSVTNRLTIILPKSNPGRITTLADLARPGLKLDNVKSVVSRCSWARPILALVLKTPPTAVLHYLGQSSTVQTISLSLVTSTTTAAAVVALGLPLAYALARRHFRGRRLVEALIDLPTALPPAVAGLAL